MFLHIHRIIIYIKIVQVCAVDYTLKQCCVFVSKKRKKFNRQNIKLNLNLVFLFLNVIDV